MSDLSAKTEEILQLFEKRAGEVKWLFNWTGREIVTPAKPATNQVGRSVYLCPLAWLAGQENYQDTQKALSTLGLNNDEGEIIYNAADGTSKHNVEVRDRLLKAAGLA